VGVSYIPVGRIGELSPGTIKEIELGGRQVLLALVEGKHVVFSRTCPHEAADLKTAGQLLQGGLLRCSNHSYCYDLSSGECILPKGGPPLTVLPVEQRGDEICVRLEW
jgi:nitrite reductase/ring-hydroxylating ferredoxin subunit